MRNVALSVCMLVAMLGFSRVGYSLDACHTVVVGTPLPTQLNNKKGANCTCKVPFDCGISVCETLPQFKNKCPLSPSASFPDLKRELFAARLVPEQ